MIWLKDDAEFKCGRQTCENGHEGGGLVRYLKNFIVGTCVGFP